MRLVSRFTFASCGAFSSVVLFALASSLAQTALPQVDVTVASPVVRRAPPRPTPARAAPVRTAPTLAAPQAAPSPVAAATTGGALRGTTPIVADQFATVTVIPSEEIRRAPASTLGDLLFSKPGITGSSFAPGASSRPIIRGLDANRVRIQENGIGANGASDLGEDHFVPVDPLVSDKVEVIRGPATLRYGSQAIGGVVETTNNRVPSALPCEAATSTAQSTGFSKAPAAKQTRPCVSFETRGAATSVDNGVEGGALLDAGGGNFAFHADASGRRTQDFRVPSYPYLMPPNPADAPRATQPGAFNGRQPNSSTQSNSQSVGGSYVFFDGFAGVAVMQNNSFYHIPGIDGENHDTRIDAHQTKVLSKAEWRGPNSYIDAVRFWGGVTDYKHRELGLADPMDSSSDGVRQIFTNKEQEARAEMQLSPFDLRFASLTTALGIQGGHQELTAPSTDNAGLWDPNSNHKVAGYIFNEFKFSERTKAQLAGRIERVDLAGTARQFADPAAGGFTPVSVSPGFTPKSASVGLIQGLPWSLVGSLTGQYVERAPKPAELFSGGAHDATATFDKGNPNLKIEIAKSVEAGLRKPTGPVRFELTAYYTRFNGFIFRSLSGNTCNPDTGACGSGVGDPNLREALYSQRDTIFRGGEFQFQYDAIPMSGGFWGVEGQYDIVRATFTDGSNVPRIPPQRLGGGIYFHNAEWLGRVFLLHAFAQNDIAIIGETRTAGYNLLRAEVSNTRTFKNDPTGIKQLTLGVSGNNLLNENIRNHVSYTKDEVLMPGVSVRVFANARF